MQAAATLRLSPLQRQVDFVRVLQTRSLAQSPHFAAHHLAGVPSLWRLAHGPSEASVGHLSTGLDNNVFTSVDTPRTHGLSEPPSSLGAVVDGTSPPAWWLGTVVPKRHARRAVTRSVLKRQIRVAFAASAAGLAPGLWIVRVRAGFDRKQFRSAASAALRQVARDELQRLLAGCRGDRGRAAVRR